MQAVAVYGFKRFAARYEICLFVFPRQSAADQTADTAYSEHSYFHHASPQSLFYIGLFYPNYLSYHTLKIKNPAAVSPSDYNVL